MHQIVFPLGSLVTALPRPLAVFKGPTSKGRRGRRREGRERKGEGACMEKERVGMGAGE